MSTPIRVITWREKFEAMDRHKALLAAFYRLPPATRDAVVLLVQAMDGDGDDAPQLVERAATQLAGNASPELMEALDKIRKILGEGDD